MAINKVLYGNVPIIDLTGVTADETDVLKGITFHKANGQSAIGSYEIDISVDGTNLNTTGDKYMPVSWSGGSYEGVTEAINLHHNGIINLQDYWHIGDERTIALASGEVMVFVLEDYATFPYAFDVKTKYVYESRRINARTSSVTLSWDNCEARTWLNSTFWDSLIEEDKSIFQLRESPYGTQDYFWLPNREMATGKIEYDPNGEPIAYWIAEFYKSTYNWAYLVSVEGNIPTGQNGTNTAESHGFSIHTAV